MTTKTRSVLSIDPGVKDVGVALFNAGELSLAFLLQTKDRIVGVTKAIEKAIEEHCLNGIDNIVLEVPQVYRNSPNPKNLIELAIVDGVFIGKFSNAKVTMYTPRQWKGTVKKEIMTKRIISKLSEKEKSRVLLPSRMSLVHNIWDAVGVGLKFEGRL